MDDTLSVLQQLAADVRDRFTGPVVGITGSVGKTTTRSLTGAKTKPDYVRDLFFCFLNNPSFKTKAAAVITDAYTRTFSLFFSSLHARTQTHKISPFSALALRSYGEVHHTRGNLNNHIGLPLTLLRTPAAAEVCVLEMGMSGFGGAATSGAYLTHRFKGPFCFNPRP